MLLVKGTFWLTPGQTVPVQVTPAELMLLVAEHSRNMKGQTMFEWNKDDVEEIERSDEAEHDRLMSKYSSKKVLTVYPIQSFRLPETFEAALKTGVRLTTPTERFMGGSPPVDVPTGDE